MHKALVLTQGVCDTLWYCQGLSYCCSASSVGLQLRRIPAVVVSTEGNCMGMKVYRASHACVGIAVCVA